MLSSDSDGSGTLRSGKIFRLGGKKRNSDKESRRYIESHTSSDSEYHSDKSEWSNWVDWIKKPDKLKTLETRFVKSSESGSSADTASPKGNLVNPGVNSATSSNQAMAGGEMRLPLLHGNGSEDPQQH